jgi:hypothetical protein
MRITPIVLSVVLATAFSLFAGDHKAKPTSTPVAVAHQKIPNTDAYFPVVGQTQAECKKQYDAPNQVAPNSDGTQTWIYVFGKGMFFIPFGAFFAKLSILRIDFDPVRASEQMVELATEDFVTLT